MNCKNNRRYKNAAKAVLVSRIVLLVVLSSICLFLPACGADGPNEAPRENQPPQDNQNEAQNEPTEEPEDQYIQPGMYKIGTDLDAGEYILYSEGDLAYFQVTKDSSGELESIVFNDNFYGSRYVTAADGQYLEFRGARMLPVEKAPPQKAQNGRYEDGMYKVGRDITAGEYKVTPDEGEMGYYEVRKDSKGSIEGIIANDNFESEKYITVKDGQYIKLSSCYIETK